MENCPICKGYRFESLRHVCPPKWYVILVGIDPVDEPQIIYAQDARIAAEIRVERWDSDEYQVIRDSLEMEVIVYGEANVAPVRFEVEGRMEATYYANRHANQDFSGLKIDAYEEEEEEEQTQPE